jgi:hypothetical protein
MREQLELLIPLKNNLDSTPRPDFEHFWGVHAVAKRPMAPY